MFLGEVHLAVGLQPLSAGPEAGTWLGPEQRLVCASGMRWVGTERGSSAEGWCLVQPLLWPVPLVPGVGGAA